MVGETLNRKMNTSQMQISFNRKWRSIIGNQGIAKLAFVSLFLLLVNVSNAQWILINEDGGTPNPKAALEIRDTSHAVLFPRVTHNQMIAIGNDTGLLVYNIDSSAIYFNNGSGWASISSSGATQFAVPAGSIIPFAGDSSKMPAGFLLCDGASLSTSAYSELYAAVGYAWGGSGSSFNLPDLRGRFIRGTDYAAGNDPDKASRTAIKTGGNTGDKVGTLQGDQFKGHEHDSPIRVRLTNANETWDNSKSYSNASNGKVVAPSGSSYTDVKYPESSATGGNETRPKNANVNYIICYSSSIAAAGTNSSVFQGSISSSQLPNSIKDSSRITDNDGSAKVQALVSDIITFTTNSSEAMRIAPNGYLGINTNSPQQLLDVAGTAVIDSLRIYNAYALPGSDGANGQVLQTDGNGKATWQTPTASPWTLDNDSLSVTGKRVGIGTDSVISTLHVKGSNSSTEPQLLVEQLANAGGDAVLSIRGRRTSSTSDFISQLRFENYRYTAGATALNRVASIDAIVTNHGTNEGDLAFRSWNSSLTATENMRITHDGKVGIGTSSPQAGLHITTGSEASLNASGGFLTIGNTGGNSLVFDRNEIQARDGSNASFLALQVKGGAISIHAGQNDVKEWAVFGSDGNLLLGDTAAANDHKLRVAGRALVDTLSILGGVEFPTDKGSTGQVLQSNGSGLATWQSPASSPWTVSGSDVYRFSGNVGIGNSSPSYALDVSGDVMANAGRFLVKDSSGTLIEFSGSQSNSYKADGAYIRTGNNPANRGAIFRVLSSGGAERLRVEHNGAVSMTNHLSVQGNSDNTYTDSMLTVAGGIEARAIKLSAGAGANKVLTSDANGSATWTTPTASPWTVSGSDVYRSGGNVGIGISNPTAPLQFANVFSDTNKKIVLFGSGNHSFYGFGVKGGILRYQTATVGDDHVFYSGAGANSSKELARITGDGFVGIGTSAPTASLHISDSGDAEIWLVADADNVTESDNPMIRYRQDGGAVGMNVGFDQSNFGSNNFGIARRYTSTDQTPSILVEVTTGHVGINNTNPTVNLDVTGNAKVSGKTTTSTFQMTTGGGNNKVLTSDASGNATWQNTQGDNLGNHTATANLAMANKNISNIASLDIGATTLTGVVGILGDGRNTINMQATNNASALSGISWQNVNSNYVWSIHRADAGSGDAELVFAGGVDNSSISALSERMRIDKTGQVGIGTNNPVRTLHVHDASSTGNYIQITNSATGTSNSSGALIGMSSNNMLVRNYASGYLAFRTGGNTSDAVRIAANNFVGIGTTNPQKKLHVSGGRILVDNGYGIDYRNAANNANNSLIKNVSGTNDVNIAETSSTSVKISVNGAANALHIETNGNVGLGTSDPHSTLHVASGDIKISNSGRLIADNSGASAVYPIIDVSTNNLVFGNTNWSNMQFHVGSTSNAMYIKNGGNVGIGTSSPASKLEVNGQTLLSNSANLIFNGPSSGTVNDAGDIIFKSGTNTELGRVYSQYGGGIVISGGTTPAVQFYVRPNGNVGVGTSSPTHKLHVNGVARSTSSTWATTSDIRAKQNVENIVNATNLLSQLRPVTFEWKEKYKEGKNGLNAFNYGFISQEVEEVIPTMVTETVEVIGTDTISDFKVLNKDPLTALLVKAFQEQQALISSQKSEIEQLKAAREEEALRQEESAAKHKALEERMNALEKMMITGQLIKE